MKASWYRVDNNASDPSVADIHIIDFIGGWIEDFWNRNFGYELATTARQFVEDLSRLDDSVKTIRVHINSPGGDVFGAVNIANALRDQQVSKGRVVETIVDGLAASAASIIMMAGSKVTMGDNALVMVHNPLTIGFGNAKQLRQIADELDIIRATIVNTYKWHSSLSDEDLIALMDAETWMDADEAIANGFATDKVEGLKAVAAINPSAVKALTIPDKYRARVEALLEKPTEGAPPVNAALDPVETMRLCREGGCLDIAEDLVQAKASRDTVVARIDQVKGERARATARANEITAICAAAQLPELSAAYIEGGMSPAAVRSQMTVITARLDAVNIDGALDIDSAQKPKARIDTRDIYARRASAATTT